MAAAAAAAGEPGSLGVVIGGSGNGEAIAANKLPGVRCALVWTDETARLGRLHNDANVVSLGARQYPIEAALRFAEIFLTTEFTQESRHMRRLAMLADYERSGELPTS
jgi:ribose 5-phosphate isomerase B